MESNIKRYAVIGHPIGHSLSPIMHNAAFRKLGVKAVYEALDIEDITSEYKRIRSHYEGINVTIPHKTAVLGLVDEVEMLADLVGAVNCISFGEKAVGYNTDVYGAVGALKTEVRDLQNKRVLVLGAGGAARAVVYGCVIEGASVFIYNRTREKAEMLSKEVAEGTGRRVGVLNKADLSGVDILVNATSVGMYPNVNESPLEGDMSGMVVMDLVYNPLETKLLRDAKSSGARVIRGVEMLVEQGAESLRIWGYKPPVDVMREAVMEKLGGRG